MDLSRFLPGHAPPWDRGSQANNKGIIPMKLSAQCVVALVALVSALASTEVCADPQALEKARGLLASGNPKEAYSLIGATAGRA